jgi:sortase A
MRATLRFLATVFVVSGVMLLLDVGVTLAWQEPLSALLSAREQSSLGGSLSRARDQAALDRRELGERPAALAARTRARTRPGRPLARIRLPTLGREYVVVEGTSTSDLRAGPGHFPGTPLPGQRGTVAVAGHRTTYGAPFRTLDRLVRGAPVELEMPYGRFVYEVEGLRIVPDTAVEVTRRVGYNRLVLTACHPLYSAEQRIVAFARLRRVRPLASAAAGSSAPAQRARSSA